MKNFNEILVSVVIPVYKAEAYIRETIKSCQDQTFTNIEIITIDDGSPDDSAAIIKSIADDRIVYKRIANSGAAEARNAGLAIAKGDLIQFLDADDILDKEKIFHQVKLYVTHGDDYLYSGAMGSIYNEAYYREVGYELYERDFTREEYFEILLNQFGKYITTGAWLTPAKLINSTHGWDKGAGLNDDGEYFMRIIMASKGIKYSNEAIFYYRRDVANSFSKVFDRKDVFEKWLYSYSSYVKQFLAGFKQPLANELGWKALSVYYCNSYPNHPDLLKECKQQMKKIGYSQPAAHGGKSLKSLSGVVGVDNALYLLRLMHKVKGLLKK